MKIHLPNSAFLGNIDTFLKSFDTTDSNSLNITFNSKWMSLHPVVLSMVAALGAEVYNKKGVINCEQPSATSKHYLVRMGLYQFINQKPVVEIKEHEPAGRFIPLTNIKTSDQLSKFLQDIDPLLHTSGHASESIKYVISELVRNVLEHSESKFGAIVCAQYFSKTHRIAIGIVDRGVGIKSTISVSHPTNDYVDALTLALTPGVTGTTTRPGGTEQNAGAGLFFIKSIAKTNRDFFIIYSGDSCYKLLKSPPNKKIVLNASPLTDKHSFMRKLPHWQGTVIGVDISTNESVDFATLLSSIRDAYNIDVKKRKERYKRAKFI